MAKGGHARDVLHGHALQPLTHVLSVAIHFAAMQGAFKLQVEIEAFDIEHRGEQQLCLEAGVFQPL